MCVQSALFSTVHMPPAWFCTLDQVLLYSIFSVISVFLSFLFLLLLSLLVLSLSEL